MKSAIAKRSVAFEGRKTSVSLEEEFWVALKDIANVRNRSLQQLMAEIESTRSAPNLSSAIRVFILAYYRKLGTTAAAPPNT
jgi:predicted DNA-binding ribbon-helix-helix protein